MGDRFRLSVVVPTHQTRELTLRCLAALWLCNPQPDEVIVVDDGSDDNTAQSVIRKYPRHIVVRLPTNQGFSVAANHGISRASGDLILLLNSDTEIELDALEAVHKAFTARPDLGIGGATLRHPGGALQWSGGRLPSTLWCFALASGIPALLGRSKTWRRLRSPSGSKGGRVDWVAGTAMVMRREVWDQAGPFDLGYRFYCQDIELCLAAADAGWKVEILPGFDVIHHHGGTISESGGAVGAAHPELMWTDLLRFAQKRRGLAGARQSSRALQMGGRLRILGRRLASPLVPGDQRPSWHAETSTYAAALRALEYLSVRDHTAPP
jgi:N-acetylglucosaminyl-diphospho-decaprenol L-rhamnosyltransferase